MSPVALFIDLSGWIVGWNWGVAQVLSGQVRTR